MASLLSDLRAEIAELSAEQVFAFVYDSIAEAAAELQANSGGYRPTMAGTVEQQFFSTDQADIVEVRLVVHDQWKRAERDESLAFRLSGTCRHRMSDGQLSDLSVTNVGLYEIQEDGSKRAVKGSVANLSLHAYLGVEPIVRKPVALSSGSPGE